MELVDNSLQRTRLLLTGITSGLLTRGASMIAPLIMMPAMLNYLGTDLFGLWITLVTITTMSLFLDFGMGNGLLTRLADCYGKQDIRLAKEYISSAYAILGFIACILLFFIILTKSLGVLQHLVPGATETNDTFINIAFICFLAFSISIPISLIQRVQFALQQSWRSNIWQLGSVLFSTIGTIFIIHMNLSSWYVITFYSVSPILVLSLSSCFFFRKKPQIAPAFNAISRRCISDLWSLGIRFLILNILMSTALNIDTIIIAKSIGYNAVTNYAIPAKLTAILGTMITVIFLPFWPASGEALANKDYRWIKNHAARMSVVSGLIIACIGCGLILFNEQIIQFWMGRTFPGQSTLLCGLTLFSVIMAINTPYHLVMNSFGIFRPQIVAWVLFLVVSLIVKIVIIRFFGFWSLPTVNFICYALFVFPPSIITAKYIIRKASNA